MPTGSEVTSNDVWCVPAASTPASKLETMRPVTSTSSTDAADVFARVSEGELQNRRNYYVVDAVGNGIDYSGVE